MKFGKKKAGAIAAGLSLVMALSPVAAFADPTAAVDTNKDVSKTLELNAGSTFDGSFGYTISPVQDGFDTATGVTVSLDSTDNALAFSKGDTEKSANITYTGTFPKVGTYAWTIEEVTTPAATGVKYNTTKESEDGKFTLVAYVTNDLDADGKIQYADGNAKTKVEWGLFDGALTAAPTDNSKKDKDGTAKFTNQFTEYTQDNQVANIKVTKKVTGAGGDTSQPFTFNVVFSVPDDMIYPTNVTKDSYLSSIATNYNGYNGANTTYDAKAGTVTVTFSEHDGQTYEFDKPGSILVGTKYSVTETDESSTGYSKSYAAVYSKDTDSKETSVTDTTNLVAQEKKNETTVTNDKGSNVITGVIVNNAPFVITIGVAAAGAVAYGAAKRKLEK